MHRRTNSHPRLKRPTSITQAQGVKKARVAAVALLLLLEVFRQEYFSIVRLDLVDGVEDCRQFKTPCLLIDKIKQGVVPEARFIDEMDGNVHFCPFEFGLVDFPFPPALDIVIGGSAQGKCI